MSTQAIDDRRFSEPSQERSRESLRRVYSAANDLLQEKTFDQITVAEISETSGVSVGSIYQRFGSKETLLWMLYGAYIEEAEERVGQLVRQETPSELRGRLEVLVREVCDLFRNHRGIVKSLLIKHRHEPGEIPEHYLGRIDDVYKQIQAFIEEACPPRTPIEKVLFCFSLVMASCRERVLFLHFPGTDPMPGGDQGFARLLSAAVSGVFDRGVD